jgi:N-hydroxyarylamine O-acetyltransferase
VRLHDYLHRIGVTGPLDDGTESLARLHVAHREAFLFENLSIQSGGGISVAPDDIERKFLDERRGGYCFEHNTLFAAVLRDAGFAPVTLLGRVRRGPPERWARTHMVLSVPAPRGGSTNGHEPWLADVGFGAIGLVEPIPLRDGATSRQGGFVYALRREPPVWVLSMRDATSTTDLYEFTDDPQTPGDIQVANHYTSTHPDSIFRRTLTLQRVKGNERTILSNLSLTRYAGGRMTTTPVDRASLPRLARELFEVELPSGPFVYESYAANPA